MSVSFHSIQVREIIRETPDASTLVFEIPEGLQSSFAYLPGQYITVKLFINGKEERRAYSFCSSPYTDTYPAITVKKVGDGVVSPFLNDQLQTGQSIQLMPPMGKFTVLVNHAASRHYMLYAGGSGITPVMSILKSVLKEEPNSRVTLVYANRDKESIIFSKTLAGFQEQYGSRLAIFHALEQTEAGFDGFAGRPGVSDYQEITRRLTHPGLPTAYYICGPGGMMDAVKQALSGMNVPEEHVHYEYFTAPLSAKEEPASPYDAEEEQPLDGTAVATILFGGREFEISVPKGQTVLEAAKDQDVDPPYACQMGVCTTCRARMLEGKVHMDEREGLSDSEIDDGYVLTCQSHPTTARIKLIYE